jgi:hypothetical protein
MSLFSAQTTSANLLCKFEPSVYVPLRRNGDQAGNMGMVGKNDQEVALFHPVFRQRKIVKAPKFSFLFVTEMNIF